MGPLMWSPSGFCLVVSVMGWMFYLCCSEVSWDYVLHICIRTLQLGSNEVVLFAQCLCKFPSFFSRRAVISSFFFWSTSKCSLKPYIVELSSMVVDCSVKLLVATIYLMAKGNSTLAPWWAPNVLTTFRVVSTCSLPSHLSPSFFSKGRGEYLIKGPDAQVSVYFVSSLREMNVTYLSLLLCTY